MAPASLSARARSSGLGFLLMISIFVNFPRENPKTALAALTEGSIAVRIESHRRHGRPRIEIQFRDKGESLAILPAIVGHNGINAAVELRNPGRTRKDQIGRAIHDHQLLHHTEGGLARDRQAHAAVLEVGPRPDLPTVKGVVGIERWR